MPALQTEEQAREYARCAADFAYFVDTYAVIYDKDQGLGFVPFKLWQGQRWLAWVLVTLRMVLILKARQLGISWLIAAYIAWKMVYQRGFTGIVVSKTEDDAIEFIARIRYILEHLPDWLKPEVGGTTKHLKVFVGGELFADCKAEAAGEDSGRSLTASVVVLDEFAFGRCAQYGRQIWTSAYPTFSRPTGGQVFVLSTMKLGTKFAELCREALRSNGDGKTTFYFAFLPWWVRPDRDAAWYRAAAENLGEDVFAEFPATPEEAFKTKTGRVVPEYDESIHLIDPFPIPAEWGWRWLTATDPGSTAPTAWLLSAVDPEGTLYFVDELYMPGVRISEATAEIKKRRIRWGVEPADGGQRVEIDLIDPASQAKKSQEIASDYQLYIEEYRKQGIPARLVPANNEPGIARLRERFKPFKVPADNDQGWRWAAKAYVFKNCQHLHEQLRDLIWDEPRYEGEDVTTWSGPDHAFDCARYISNYVPQPGKGPKPAEKTDIQKAKEAKVKALQRARARFVR